MNNYLRGGLTIAFTLLGGAAMAAGSGTGIEAGFTEVGDDLQTLLGGAGGFLIVIISIGLAAVFLAIGRGFGQAVIAFAVALFLGYGVTGTTDMLSQEHLLSPQDTIL